MSRPKRTTASATDSTPVQNGDAATSTAEAASGSPVRIRKVLPPEGRNAILDRYVKVGEEFEVSPAVADDLLRHGEFEVA